MRPLVAALAGLGVLIAGFVGLALAVVLGLAATGAVLALRLTSRLRPAVTRRTTTRDRAPTGSDRRAGPDYKIWNDGRGTIIDM